MNMTDMRKKNINLAMATKESPALDLTRQFVYYTPRTVFKGEYQKSVEKSNTKLMDYISKNHNKKPPIKIIPYLYDAKRRGLSVPQSITNKYNMPGEGYLRNLNMISSVPAEKYVGTSMSVAGALTGLAGLDWAQEALSGKSAISAKGWQAAAEGPAKLKTKLMGARGAQRYDKLFEHPLSSVLGRQKPKTSRLIERVLGSAHSIPLTGLAAMPLMSRRVLKKLKGKDTASKRYKTFDWVERNPDKTMGMAYAPIVANTLVGGGYDMAQTLKNAPRGRGAKALMAVGSLGRTGVTLGRVGLSAAIPLMFMKMRRHMTDSREKEQDLINSRIIKKPTQGSGSRQ